MISRMSTLFVRTLREDPADAEVPSHRLLVRAGYIRRAAPGIYTWLPLGLRVLRRIEGIIREEMDAIGAQEVSFPALLPREPYEATGRWTEYGDGLFRLQDRKGADYLLGPTHEEMFTLLVKDLYCSYKDLPLSIYQIQTKYRDEARPRAGILRGREFIMKDSYSFDVDDAGLEASLPDAPRGLHPDLRPARLRLRHRQGDVGRDGRLGVRGVPGQGRRRRGHLRPVHNCDYAANVEAVEVPRRRHRSPYDDAPAGARRADAGHPDHRRRWSTTSTRRSRARTGRGRRRTPSRTSCSRCATPTARTEALAVGLPGDREVDTKRLEAAARRGSASSRSARRTSRHRRPWPRATSARGRWGRRPRPACASWSTRASSRAPGG